MTYNSLPPKHPFELYIAIPASITLTEHTLLLKTVKVGIVARALAIYRVDGVIVYVDRSNAIGEVELIRDILEYLATPPYLRRKLIPLKETLRYAGILPPLKTPNHPKIRSIHTHNVEFREGVVVSIRSDGVALVDVGLSKLAELHNANVKPGDRVIVKVYKRGDSIKCLLSTPKYYWCYSVHTVNSLEEVLRFKRWSLKIATSKYGDNIVKLKNKLRENLLRARSVLVAFGSPYEGLWEIARREGLKLNRIFHYILNTIPYQGTETVRTEEAIYATLEALCLIEAENL